MVCDVRFFFVEENSTRLTVGGDKIKHPGDCGIPITELPTVNVLLNCVISTLGSKFMTLDTKNVYLNTPLELNE